MKCQLCGEPIKEQGAPCEFCEWISLTGLSIEDDRRIQFKIIEKKKVLRSNFSEIGIVLHEVDLSGVLIDSNPAVKKKKLILIDSEAAVSGKIYFKAKPIYIKEKINGFCVRKGVESSFGIVCSGLEGKAYLLGFCLNERAKLDVYGRVPGSKDKFVIARDFSLGFD
ncbi:MAG: hypothetical protein LBC41_17525 [Clostridiales bacterium]|jgi:hypothetical protein|nr:hypothetical protein [Clostridiales bacterium]MDR2752459.1 hypothetical protein [Clostridiales bacterium]